MAFALHNYVHAILLLVLVLIPFKGTCSSQNQHHHRQHRPFHFTLFQHATINRRGYVIVNGIEEGEGISEKTTPFGTLFVFQDPLTVKANRSSKQFGTAEGTSITSCLNGLSSILVAKLTLRVKNDHKGYISIVGGTNNLERSDYPVVGGTEDFMFVHGCVNSFPIHLKSSTFVYKNEFHLYCPSYPPLAS